MTSIAPLLMLKNLTTFRIDRLSLPLTNTDVLQFATAWPKIRTLHLPFDLTYGASEPSMDALFALADICHDLRHLQIPIHTKEVNGISSRLSQNRVQSHPLRTLIVACPNDSRMTQSDLLLLSRHLDALFPHLKTLTNVQTDALELWNKVHLMIVAFRAVRAESLPPPIT